MYPFHKVSTTKKISKKNKEIDAQIANYLNINNLQKVEELFNYMLETDIDIQIKQFNIFISKMTKEKKFKKIEILFQKMKNLDYFSYRNLIQGYYECNQFDSMEKLFHVAIEKDVEIHMIHFSIFIKKKLQEKEFEKVENLFKKMKNLNDISYSILIHAYLESDNLKRVEELFYELIEKKIEIRIIQFTIFMKRMLKEGEFERVENLFKKVKNLNEYSYSILIQAFLKINDLKKVEKLFKEMEEKKIEKNFHLQTQYSNFKKKLKTNQK